MKYKTFKDFLMGKHAKEFPQILDDNLPDAFERWLSALETNETIEYADEYAAIQRQEIVKEIEKLKKRVVKEMPNWMETKKKYVVISYVVISCDRHRDDIVWVFKTYSAAREFAEKEFDKFNRGADEEDEWNNGGLLYHKSACDDDYKVNIFEAEYNKPLTP